MPPCKHHEICGRDALEGDDLCILHSQDPAKEEKAFNEALIEHHSSSGDNFSHFVFPVYISFYHVKFAKADFSHARFLASATFSDANFETAKFNHAMFMAGAMFLGAKFVGRADFTAAEFAGEVEFTNAEFTGAVRMVATTFKKSGFSGATFTEKVDFAGAKFARHVVFEHVRFGAADFGQATFATAEFTSAIFGGKADFHSAKFNRKAYFWHAVFDQRANFSRAVFDKGADFNQTVFLKGADFGTCEFNEKTAFVGSRFNIVDNRRTKNTNTGHADSQERPSFSYVAFNGVADFGDAIFAKGVAFDHARFSKEANFNHVLFSKNADFGLVSFNDRADFSRTMFNQEGADFRSAVFNQGADFVNISILGDVVLRGSRILGRTIFDGQVLVGKILVFSGIGVEFTNVVIEPLDALTVRDADLRNCLFAGTDLRKAEFTNVMWPRIEDDLIRGIRTCLDKLYQRLKQSENLRWSEISKYIRGRARPNLEQTYGRLRQKYKVNWQEVGDRFGVYDEIEAVEKGETDKYPHIEQLYRQLKQNYEDRKDYERASDFHYGEKEMRRKNPETHRGLRFLLTLYWLVSGYGERWVRPLIWAAGLLVICAVLYLFLGLHPKNGGAAISWMSGWDWLESTLYSFRVMTLLKPDDLVPDGLAAKFLNAIQSIVGPIILGLFALALRQRLKR